MSLSVAAIEKHQDALAKLIATWIDNNPNDTTATAAPESKPASPAPADAPKQVVTVALRTRPFLDNESTEGKQLLNGVHARGRKMFVHVPSAKVCTDLFALKMSINVYLVVRTDYSAQGF